MASIHKVLKPQIYFDIYSSKKMTFATHWCFQYYWLNYKGSCLYPRFQSCSIARLCSDCLELSKLSKYKFVSVCWFRTLHFLVQETVNVKLYNIKKYICRLSKEENTLCLSDDEIFYNQF